MRLAIYEWVTGGGLVGCEGPLPESLLREGLAMVQAVAADAASIEGITPVLMRDLRLPQLAVAGGEVIEVSSRSEHDRELTRLGEQGDAVIVIAPETDGALLRAIGRLEAAGANLLSPGSAFAAIAGDKQRTAEALARAGVPTPEGLRLESDDPLPDDFPYPAVVKPLDGAGSQDTHIVANALDRPPAYAWPRRLERFVPGLPASVALIGTAHGEPIALPPCRQRISTDARMTYLGGATPLAGGLANRAIELALRTSAALPPLVGYAGVDLVLGDDPDGSLDVVIEVNPRLSTSYVGLRRIVHGGLVRTMLAASAGERPSLEIDPRPIAWDADGVVYWSE